MAQMNFYFSDKEIRELFWYINFKGGQIIPDILYNSDHYVVATTYEDFIRYQQTETTHFFLIDKTFFIEPLVVTKNRFMENNKYAINQRKGGPYIDLMFFRGYAEDAVIHYKRSSVDVYSKFIYTDGRAEFKATTELKEYYNDIVKFIKHKSKTVKRHGKGYWIGEEAFQDLQIAP